MLLERLLKQVVKTGSLTLIDAKGTEHCFGEGNIDTTIIVRLHEPGLARRIFFTPHIAVGEAYMDGALTIENGDIYDFLDLIGRNLGIETRLPFDGLRRQLGRIARRLQQYNPLDRAGRNVRHHYDLSGALYDLFLDRDRQYSCAYFARPDMSLDEAQEEKKKHLAAKLLLKDGQRILDIGSGWGGMGLYLAETANVDVTGVTLSTEQHAVSQDRAKTAGLADRVRFDLRDYRQVTGRFDRIVSVGMFEHVGVPHYEEFFTKVADLLADDGVAMLHSIGRMEGPGTTSPWIRRYIFPGGYSPALSEVIPVIERCGLWITDIEILRLHYAETLREWRRRFAANWHRVAELYDERFCRMWEFYLAGSEVTFRHRGHMVFQIQMAKQVDSVPLTRDYVYEWERRQRRREMAA